MQLRAGLHALPREDHAWVTCSAEFAAARGLGCFECFLGISDLMRLEMALGSSSRTANAITIPTSSQAIATAAISSA